MADISYSVNVNANADGLVYNASAANITSDVSTAGIMAVTLSVGTATQAISTSVARNLGLCMARALHTNATHSVSFGRLDGTNFYGSARLLAQEAAVLRLEPGNYGAKANAEGARLSLVILEE